MYWQFNDCWGVCSWSSIDYYGNYKALQYGARHFNAPLSVSVEDTDEHIKIFVLNDLNNEQPVEAEYILFDFEKGIIEKHKTAVDMPALENRLIFELDVNEIKRIHDYRKTGICARLYQNGEQINQKVVLLDNEKNLCLPKAKLKTKIFIEDKQLRLLLFENREYECLKNLLSMGFSIKTTK